MSFPSQPRASHRSVLAVVLLAVFFSFSLPQSLLNPVLPQLQAELNATQSQITWVITAYLLSATICTPVLGSLGDRYGRDRVLVLALVVLALGTLVAAVAQGIGLMIVGRLVQGAGSGVLPLSFAIIRDEMPPAKVPGAIGAVTAVAAAGGGLGLLIAGPLVDLLGVRSLFWTSLAATVVVVVAAKFVIPASRTRQPGVVNWLTAALLAVWLTAVLLPLAEGSRWGWSSPLVIGSLSVGVVLAVCWGVLESRASSPLIDLRLMSVPAIWTSNAISLLMGIGLFSAFGFTPVFAQTPSSAGYGFGASVTEAGLLLLPMTVTMFVAGLVAARLVVRFGARRMFVGSTALNVVALLVLALRHDHRWQVLLAMALLGIACGTAFATMSSVIVATVPPGRTGVANGVNTNVRTLGGALGSAMVGGIIAAYARSGGSPAEEGFTYGFAAAAAFGVIAVGVSFLVPRETRQADLLSAAEAGSSRR